MPENTPPVRPTTTTSNPASAATTIRATNPDNSDVAKRASEKKGKDQADLDSGEALEAAVKGELSTETAPVNVARQPLEAFEEKVIAANGLPYVGVDEQFHTNPDLIEERNAKIEAAAKDSKS